MNAGHLQARQLVVRFPGQVHPLFNISHLEVPAGHSLGIRGPSGAGKSTLFHCLAGIASLTEGEVRWGDTALGTLSNDARDTWRRQNVGLIFQDFHLIEGLSALENVVLPVYFARWKANTALKDRARALLARVGIDSFDRQASVLSRGERQRVAFARALLFQPPIVMADEPTASLDPDHRRQIGDLLLELVASEGATLVVISHESELLARMDDVALLKDGALHRVTHSDPLLGVVNGPTIESHSVAANALVAPQKLHEHIQSVSAGAC